MSVSAAGAALLQIKYNMGSLLWELLAGAFFPGETGIRSQQRQLPSPNRCKLKQGLLLLATSMLLRDQSIAVSDKGHQCAAGAQHQEDQGFL